MKNKRKILIYGGQSCPSFNSSLDCPSFDVGIWQDAVVCGK